MLRIFMKGDAYAPYATCMAMILPNTSLTPGVLTRFCEEPWGSPGSSIHFAVLPKNP